MRQNIGIWFVRLSLVLLFLGLFFGHLASESYRLTEAKTGVMGFLSLRPLHVSSAYLGIISAGIGFVSIVLQKIKRTRFGTLIQFLQLLFWFIALVGIFYSYFTGDFGGREYWEFNPKWALPLFISFVFFLIYFIHQVKTIAKWPVYYWMWFTGIVFFMFCFIENYLWLFPYFKNHFIADMTIQWKVNGSLVGSINQLIYGVAFYLMEKISGNEKSSFQKLSFAMYFLGLFNLMFNWGHHIYILPTEKYIHYIAYIVSMTEWIILIRIFYLWGNQLSQDVKHYHFFPYRFLMASDYWVLLNLCLAIFMSIPAVNLFTHGTHITVAHSMGTTIGINTMIILAAAFYFIQPTFKNAKFYKIITTLFWVVQLILVLFLVALTAMGVNKAYWRYEQAGSQFSDMFTTSMPYITTFIITGTLLFFSLGFFFIYLFIRSFKSKIKNF